MTNDVPPRAKPADTLTGLRVLDLSQNLAGPYCTQILADLGADVLKVEPDGGDPARAWGPPFHDGAGTIFRAANRGKRSTILDLKQEEGRDVLRSLIAEADVFVQSFRAGVIERLGFGPAGMRERHPGLIYVSIAAYGEDGPLRDRPGYDPLMQAHGGLLSVTGAAGAPARVGTSIIDMGTGLWAVIGVLAALRERDRTGVGAHITAALFETALAWNAYHLMGWYADGTVPAAMGTSFPLIAPYGAFACTDGLVMIAAANDRLFQRLCAALDLHGLAGDERFATNPARVHHRGEVDAAVAGALRRYSCREAMERLQRAGVPCAPVLDVAAVAKDAQTLASGVVAHDPADPNGPHVLPPLRWDGARVPLRGGVPGPGTSNAAWRASMPDESARGSRVPPD